MKKYQEITNARRLLELPERATMAEIKTHYRKLMRYWHPDMCKETEQRCREMSSRISAAYNIIIEYCGHYRFSFSMEEVRENLSEEEWLHERFGKDPVWGSGS